MSIDYNALLCRGISINSKDMNALSNEKIDELMNDTFFINYDYCSSWKADPNWEGVFGYTLQASEAGYPIEVNYDNIKNCPTDDTIEEKFHYYFPHINRFIKTYLGVQIS